MGITGLWKIVEPTGTEIPLECLEGKKLAIDISIWIYQAQTAYPSDQPYPHLRLLVSRLSKLLFYKIRPVFVFDGPNVPILKKQVLESRRNRLENEENPLKNTKKLRKLKEIAGGKLDDVALQKTIQEVISPSKKSKIQNDFYQNLGEKSIDLTEKSVEIADKMNYSDSTSSDDEFEDVQILETPEESQKTLEDVRILNRGAARREEMQNLLDKREIMRNSRLRPDMIPDDSKSFSNFQMQRILQRGRLNAQIQQLAASTSTSSSGISGISGISGNSDKINVTGPDGTRHVLQYAYSDEIQQISNFSEEKREIESLYNEKRSQLEMTLDVFNVEYGGKVHSREVTPDDIREEIVERMEEKLVPKKTRGYESKSGMLEAIARKRIKQHYGGTSGEDSEKYNIQVEEEPISDDISDDEMALQSVLLESAAEKLKNDSNPLNLLENEEDEEEWDPQRYDKPSTSTQFVPLLQYPNDKEDDGKTPELYKDLQEFLTICGIPWIESPGEAEAQCVELERLKLVDGVVSDDSDVWAFGVRHVYRHMFSKNRRVQRYGEVTAANRNNLDKFCLQREDYITIGILSGGDYCSGLNKVGAIGALELVAEFVENRKNQLEDLEKVRERIQKLLEKVRHLFVTPPEDFRNVSRNAMMMRRHVNEANEKEVIDMVCTNTAAIDAYLHPFVDTSSEKFRWRQMNLQHVRQLLRQRLQWPEKSQFHEEKNTFDAFQKWNSFISEGGKSQMRLDRFFAAQKIDNPLEFQFSKKMVEALEKIARKSTQIEENNEKEVEILEKPKKSPKKAAKRGRGRGRGGRGRGRGRGAASAKPPRNLNLSEESSEGDSFDEA